MLGAPLLDSGLGMPGVVPQAASTNIRITTMYVRCMPAMSLPSTRA